MNHVLLTHILCLGWINAPRERERGWPHRADTGELEAERDQAVWLLILVSSGSLSSGPPLTQITPAKLSPVLALQPCLGRHRLYAVDVYKPPGQWHQVHDSVTWAIMTVSNIRLLFTLGAALPFSQEPGLQPVFTWTASLACGHFLGQLFRHLAGAGHQVTDEDEEVRSDVSQEQVAATPSRPQPSQQRPHENTPRGRMVRNTRQRMQDKRQKHLRGSFQKRNDKNSSEPAEPVLDNRGTMPVTEDRLLSEAARTLDNICSDYLCSLERKKVNQLNVR